ncbi:MAG: oligosaccharide flippase family protein, partial [Actinomycetota bacterium]|nr:oligosaccharide flippase family protein [Actinomycetota bacterium]
LTARRVFGDDVPSGDGAATASEAALRRFGLRGLLGWVSPTETLRVDQLVVGLVLSAYDLGLYVAALAFTNLPRFLAQAVGNVAYPRVAVERNFAAQRRQMWRYVAFGTAVSTVVAGLLAAAADPLVRLAFGDAFGGAVGPLRLLLLATVTLCARRVLSEAMRGAGFAGATSRAEIASWLSLVPTLPLLGLEYGLDGVALALCSAYLLSLFTLLWVMAASRTGPSICPRQGSSLDGAGS